MAWQKLTSQYPAKCKKVLSENISNDDSVDSRSPPPRPKPFEQCGILYKWKRKTNDKSRNPWDACHIKNKQKWFFVCEHNEMVSITRGIVGGCMRFRVENVFFLCEELRMFWCFVKSLNLKPAAVSFCVQPSGWLFGGSYIYIYIFMCQFVWPTRVFFGVNKVRETNGKNKEQLFRISLLKFTVQRSLYVWFWDLKCIIREYNWIILCVTFPARISLRATTSCG